MNHKSTKLTTRDYFLQAVERLKIDRGVKKGEIGKVMGYGGDNPAAILTHIKNDENRGVDPDRLKIFIRHYNLNEGYFTGETDLLYSSTISPKTLESLRKVADIAPAEFIELPEIDAAALGGMDENIYQNLYRDNSGKKYIVLKTEPDHFYENAAVLPIEGDSMAPQLKNGTKVIVKKISSGNYQYANGVFAISIKGGFFQVWRITKCIEGKLLIGEKDNPDFSSASLALQIADILWMAQIVMMVPTKVY